MPLVNITVLEAGLEAPIVGAVNHYYTNPAAIYVGSAVTDVDGVASIVLPDDDYFVMVVPTWEYISARNEFTVTTLGPNDWDFLVTRVQFPASADSIMCTVSGFVRDPTGQLVRDKHLCSINQAYNPIAVNNTLIFAEERHIASDKDGWVQFDVIRGTYYNVALRPSLNDTEKASEQLTRYGPEAASATLTDFLFPCPASVAFTPTTVSLTVEGVENVGVTVTWSNTEVTTGGTQLEFLEDPIYSIRTNANGLAITGYVVGTQTCTVSGWFPTAPEESRVPLASISGSFSVTVT